MAALQCVARKKKKKREEKHKKKQQVIYGDGRMTTDAVLHGWMPNCRLNRCSSGAADSSLVIDLCRGLKQRKKERDEETKPTSQEETNVIKKLKL